MAKLPVDIAEQDELAHFEHRFWLVPRLWAKYSYAPSLSWKRVRLHEDHRTRVPDRTGVYSLVIRPEIASHTACAYLVYVGQSVSLRKRFGKYLTRETKPSGRPKLRRVIFKYPDHLWFYFAEIRKRDLDKCENALLAAYLPPYNDRFPAVVRRAVSAFR